MTVSSLSAEQRARFAVDGFLVVPEFVPAAECDALMDRARALVDAFDPATISIFSTNEQTRTSDDYFLDSGDDVRFFFEEEAFLPDGKTLRQAKALSINKIGHALHARDEVFTRFSTQRAIADVVAGLDLRAPVMLQSMYIFKNAFIGGDVGCHQDATFLYTDPISVVGLWFALEDATLENGCLWAEPGGHRGPVRQRFVRAGATDADGTRFEELDPTPLPEPGEGASLVPLEVEAGTLVVLHGRLPHWSGPNRSARSRHAYSVHVIDGRAEYPAANWLQRPADLPLRGF